MALLSLPEEMVAAIADLIPVDSILSFALACKATLRHVKERLERCRLYDQRYRIQHDRKPLTSATLLRLAINNPEAAWFIRAFDFWGSRPGYNKWRSWDFVSPEDDHNELTNTGWPDGPEDYTMLFDESFFELKEYHRFEAILTDVLQLSSKDAVEWMQKLRDGWDEPVKGMLFALAPKLDRLNFIACAHTLCTYATGRELTISSYDSWQNGLYDYTNPLAFLRISILSVFNALPRGVRWPPGFASLRAVFVGSPSDYQPDVNECNWSPYEIAPLFLLPNIRVLYFMAGLGHDDDDPDIYLPEGSSTVEDLSFHLCERIPLEIWEKFVSAPKALRIFNSVQSSRGRDEASFQSILAAKHAGSLENLSIENICQPTSYFRSFSKLKIIHQLPAEILLLQQRPGPATSKYEAFQFYLPPCVQRLHIPFGLRHTPLLSSEVWHHVLSAVVDLAEDPRFPSLVEVCLFDLPRHFESDVDTDFANKWGDMSELIKRIEAAGVATHLQYWDAQFQRNDWHAHRKLHPLRVFYQEGLNESDPRPLHELE